MNALAAALVFVTTLTSPPQATASAPIVVASKPFGESYLLAEMFAQLLESRGIPVQRRPGLGATEIAFSALRSGAIDVYPEYTGTGLIAILGATPSSNAREVFRTVSREFHTRWLVMWMPPLGFQNTYAIAVRKETAERYKLHTLSDLTRGAPSLTAGFSPDFIGRSDGLPGLAQRYGMHFRDVRSLLQAIKYQALAEGKVDVIDGYSTDGQIARYDLVVLQDDRAFFPPYEAAALLSARAAGRADVVAALARLSGRLDENTMRGLNERIEVQSQDIAKVARDALSQLGLLSAGSAAQAGRPDAAKQGFAGYMWARRSDIARLTMRHLVLVALSLGAAIVIAVPAGVALERARAHAEQVIRAVGILQTLPSIALLAFMIPLLGIGVLPALVALLLYSLYPIIRNTYTGVRDAAPDAALAAEALGMTPWQALFYVRLPIAAPVIMAGIRTAAVIAVGTATLAAFIGAGGLGDPIVAGLALSDTRMILSGAVPAALLALLVDGGLALVERGIAPRGMRTNEDR
jgi:osmoprotectant transport system permease protein